MSKSRGEKGRSSAQPPVAPPPVVLDIVPGKLNETQWKSIVDIEEGYELVNDIVSSIVESACDTIYDKDINQKLIPYCVDQVEELLTEIIKWQFLPYDAGINSNTIECGNWVEDEAPRSSIPDNWAQGVVPVISKLPEDANATLATPSPEQKSEETQNISRADEIGLSEEVTVDSDAVSSGDFNMREAIATVPSYVTPDDSPETTVVQCTADPMSDRGEEKSSEKMLSAQVVVPNQKRITKFQPYKGKMPTYRNVTLTPITKDKGKRPNMVCNHGSSHELLHKQGTTISSLYNKKDNIVALQKFTPERLPSRRIRTRFEIVEQPVEVVEDSRRNGRKRLPGLRTKRPTGVNPHGAPSEPRLATDDVIGNCRVLPLPPPLVDVMMLSPGVVAKVGSVVKSGPKQSNIERWGERRISNDSDKNSSDWDQGNSDGSSTNDLTRSQHVSFRRQLGKATVAAE